MPPAEFAPLPAGPFDILLADPPWSYYGSPDKDQAAGKHYPCLTPAELAALPVAEISARPSVLFLWATSPQLEAAIHLLRAWGFRARRTVRASRDVPWRQPRSPRSQFWRRQRECRR